MLFILFWTLTVLFTWQSMGQSQNSCFHPKYLKLCSEDEAFMGLERHGGKVINDKAEISDTFWEHQRLILHIVKTSPLRSQKSSALSEIISSIIFNLFYLE